MKPIKIAFFDIDGTVVDMDKKQISEKMLETLERLKKNNVIICMATGRTPMTLPDFKDIFDVYLTFNGSYCFNKQQTIFTNPLDTKDVQRIIKNVSSIKYLYFIRHKMCIINCNAEIVCPKKEMYNAENIKKMRRLIT